MWRMRETPDMKACIFCSTNCAELPTPNFINEYQARHLCNVLNFEASSPLNSEFKFLGRTTCSICLGWLEEVVSVGEEWETILDKVRVLAEQFRHIMNTSGTLSGTSFTKPQMDEEWRESHVSESGFQSLQYSETRQVKDEMSPLILSGNDEAFKEWDDIAVKCDWSPPMSPLTLNSNVLAKDERRVSLRRKPSSGFRRRRRKTTKKNDDPDWILGNENESHMTSLESISVTSRPVRNFTPTQIMVLTQEYERHKKILESTKPDDPDPDVRNSWEAIAAAVSNIKGNSQKTPSMCWAKLESIISHSKQLETETYIEQTCAGPVRLKYLQIRILKCDDPNFSVPHRMSRKTEAAKQIRKGRKMMNFLRKKAQKRHDKLKYRSKLGRPIKYVELYSQDGKEEACHVPGCRYVTSDSDLLAGHYRGKHLGDRRPYKCVVPNCGKEYTEFRRLSIHRAMHKGWFQFSCEHCGRNFTRKDTKEMHILRSHSKTPPNFPCHLCSRSFIHEKLCTAHIRAVHGPKTHKCPFENCEYASTTKSALHSHQKACHSDSFPQVKEDNAMCAECGATFKRLYALNAHMTRKHGNLPIEQLKPVSCSYEGCKFRCESNFKLTRHVDRAHENTERTINCTFPNCRRFYKSKEGLKKHIERKHGATSPPPPPPRKFMCTTCGKALHSMKALKDHIAVRHKTGNKNDFRCPRCNVGFAIQKYVDRHMKRFPTCQPKELRPDAVSCDICHKYCSNMAGLKRHMLLLHAPDEQKAWGCDKCGKAFPIRMYLTRHLRESKSCGLHSEHSQINTTASYLGNETERQAELESQQQQITAPKSSIMESLDPAHPRRKICPDIYYTVCTIDQYI